MSAHTQFLCEYVDGYNEQCEAVATHLVKTEQTEFYMCKSHANLKRWKKQDSNVVVEELKHNDQ